jgi:GT2 family glycosyltransferase
MKLCIIVASAGRPSTLKGLLGHLDSQEDTDFSVIICVPDEASKPAEAESIRTRFQLIIGPRGASAQRNAALRAVGQSVEAVIFLDDDAVPTHSYIKDVKRVLAENPTYVAFSGAVLLDGAQLGRELAHNEILTALNLYASSEDSQLRPTESLYGCNLVSRMPQALTISFDERLPLYSWLEDLDFSKRIQRLGSIGRTMSCAVVHIGSGSGGRLQHERFGYSQITNAVYLRTKSSIDSKKCLLLIGRPLVRNIVGSILGNSTSWRRQRLRGNILSLCDLVRGRVLPERIVSLV